MWTAAQEPSTAVYGGIHQFKGVYYWRIRGESGATGPKRLTREEAAKDGAEVTRAISGASGLEEKQALARNALRMLTEKQSAADKEEVKHAEEHFTRQADRLMLSQAAEEHAVPLAVSLEINRVHMCALECATIPELHGLRWAHVSDILPRPYGKSACGPFPGLRNLGNTCFLNAVCQCLLHVPRLRRCLREPGAVRCHLPRVELSVSFERLVGDYIKSGVRDAQPGRCCQGFLPFLAKRKAFRSDARRGTARCSGGDDPHLKRMWAAG